MRWFKRDLTECIHGLNLSVASLTDDELRRAKQEVDDHLN